MPNMTLALSADLKAKMDRFKEINWSEVARQAIYEKMVMLDKMNQMFAKSKLSEPEAEVYAAKIKKAVFKKYNKKK